MCDNTAMTAEQAASVLESGFDNAEKVLKDSDKLDEIFRLTEEKLKSVPLVGTRLSYVAVMASMIKSYVDKEYTSAPPKCIIAMLSAVIYFASPIDLIGDAIPVAGYVDDAVIIAACLNMVDVYLKEYIAWRESNV